MEILFYILISLVTLCLILQIVIYLQIKELTPLKSISARIDLMGNLLIKLESCFKEEFALHRREFHEATREGRKELSESLMRFRQQLMRALEKDISASRDLQREKLEDLQKEQEKLIAGTEKKLEQVRQTVDEKLQKTLNERLGRSFEAVGKQLSAVQEGLGEMRHLAQDVGGLKKILSNVKMRGGFGEMQLSMLLDQLLAPDQYQANIITRKGSSFTVEFAIKLPGLDNQRPLWLPIDAKFPKDAYEQLQQAYDNVESNSIESAQKNLENTLKKMARDINEKYLDPPHTTDFGILFLPFESLYGEVVKKAALLEELQRVHKVVVTGPTTLAALLNSLQIGFRTLAIQKRSSQVWEILSAVKTEFEKFGGMLQKAQNNLQTASNQLEEVMGKRTRAIERKLKNIESFEAVEPQKVLSEAEEF
ncbi:DNA recombination protein RmuC [Bacteroidetes bacterium endosymbiont of Geopemphigus sp.]|uniref:DNA recombination protein RmuC n=1 Tax=Bacteroidetes bacterium endosymbiont of Geopemphigus sp. TaxID=2047937 RepID=UPI000CD28529|nr:DNA recombination protein RmuC [Bacteroidetes bacterium endosymbiont of Geopemphigus sp.]